MTAPEIKIVYMKEILRLSYDKFKENKKKCGITLNKHLIKQNYIQQQQNALNKQDYIQQQRNNKDKLKFWKISFFKKMSLKINKVIQENISNDIDKVWLFRKMNTKKNKTNIKKNESKMNNWIFEIYYCLYDEVKKHIIAKIGNDYHYVEILFNSKKDLIKKVNDEKKIPQNQKEFLINKVWKKINLLI